MFFPVDKADKSTASKLNINSTICFSAASSSAYTRRSKALSPFSPTEKLQNSQVSQVLRRARVFACFPVIEHALSLRGNSSSSRVMAKRQINPILLLTPPPPPNYQVHDSAAINTSPHSKGSTHNSLEVAKV